MYSDEGLAWVLDTRYVTDSVASAAFCGAGKGNSKRPFVGYRCARDDTRNVNNCTRLCNKYDWAGKTCAASRF